MTSSEPRGKNEKEDIWVQTDIFSRSFKIVATAFKAPFYLSRNPEISSKDVVMVVSKSLSFGE